MLAEIWFFIEQLVRWGFDMCIEAVSKILSLCSYNDQSWEEDNGKICRSL